MSGSRASSAGIVTAFVLLGFLALGVGGSAARPAQGNVTITFLTNGTTRQAYDVLVPNFERVYPNINVKVEYAATAADTARLITTRLASGNAPDVFVTWPGCGTTISICKLAKAGDLARMVNRPWTRYSHPLSLSYSKYKSGLYSFSPGMTLDGLWTNDTLFSKLGLKVPQTFPQLLDTCRAAKAAGTIPVLAALQGSLVIQQLAADIALTTVYAKGNQWAKKLEAGKVTFQGTPGWHQALQEIVDMKNAGCFQTGAAGLTSAAGDALFGQGRALMYVCLTSHKAAIDAAHPQIAYSQHPFPGPAGTASSKTKVLLNLALSLTINAHASAEHRAAAQKFVDFVARPKQNVLFTQITGGISQSQLKQGELPGYLSSFAARFKNHEYGINPVETWWNADVGDALTTYGTGLITGQTTVEDVLEAMDKGWQRGPS
jgi:raffinose/stachyose/melibiose transport system substrate-binding protein